MCNTATNKDMYKVLNSQINLYQNILKNLKHKRSVLLKITDSFEEISGKNYPLSLKHHLELSRLQDEINSVKHTLACLETELKWVELVVSEEG